MNLLIYCWIYGFYAAFSKAEHSQKPPNFLLVVTDDQDVVLNGLVPMKNVQNLLMKEGITFQNAFTTSPLCCPSRATILSGLYAHNHKTTNNSVSGNCYGYHWKKYVEPNAIPVTLQSNGYETFFAGKYLNEYYTKAVPPGWNHFYGLHGNSRYYNYSLTENGKVVNYTNEYLTDLLSEKLVKFLNEKHEKPFFAYVAPPAPHEPFTPADRHKNTFADVTAPRTPNFNIPSDCGSMKRTDELDNTYIIYTSDNGYHIGQFAQPKDKRQPYETDIRVPLVVRGPNIGRKVMSEVPVALVDLVPTVKDLAGGITYGNEDGISIRKFMEFPNAIDKSFHRQLLIQYWGEGNLQSYSPECPWKREDRLAQCHLNTDCHCTDSWNNTYACVRHFAYRTNRIYCEFKDNE
uniref:Sulfatase N-terminal domain-containing protein n=1 Tax=Megaselia scalaris TaxID=36166 RepID=T1GS38_MEGSC